PALFDARYVESLFEVKTVLLKNEVDDGRPILFEKHAELPGCYSILGGRMDNSYDVTESLTAEEFGKQVGLLWKTPGRNTPASSEARCSSRRRFPHFTARRTSTRSRTGSSTLSFAPVLRPKNGSPTAPPRTT